MKKRLLPLLVTLCAAFPGRAQNDTVFFELKDNSSMIFPREYIENWEESNKYITLTLTGDTTVVIAKSHIRSQENTYQGELPHFISYKFNNKFNDQLFTDAEGTIDADKREVTVSVGCIGKRLTPSFQLPEGAAAYIDGKRQYSKKTRLRFDNPVTYTLAYPKQYIYKIVKVSDEVWSTPDEDDGKKWISDKVNLTSDMLSTNAPSNHGEDPANLLDNDPNTIFHSTWGNGAYPKLAWDEKSYYGDGTSEWPYLEMNLPEALHHLKFEYTTRNNNDYAPLGLILQGSENGTDWTDIRTFTAEDDDLPTLPGSTYGSPVIDLKGSYKHLRLQLTKSQKKNYLVLSEFALYKVTKNPDYEEEEPVLISPAEYRKGFEPYGTEYKVMVDYLTDHPTSAYNVPRIDIWFGDKETWSSSMWIGRNGKTYYEDATIKIDGAGVYPDMEETPVLIKGRGNSTWTNAYNSKNPYRIKFEQKQKPLGMTKGKSWVLLSNKQTGSMTTNAIAMKVADMVETRGCNHIVPVELYINNQYRGSYNFTEKVGFHNNSIDIADETKAAMLELDTYTDEIIYTESTYSLATKIKEPDFSDPETVTILTANDIMNSFNNMTSDMKWYCDEAKFDVESVVSAMLVTDLVRNEELMHPKSWFLYNEDVLADSLWNLGPVWDFDWSFGYERGHNYFITAAEVDLFYYMSNSNKGSVFFKQLLRGSDKVKKAYYRLWTDFMESGKLDELLEYCDEYYAYARPSLVHNQDGVDNTVEYYGQVYHQSGWGDGNSYDKHTANAKSWLTKRANYIYSKLDKYDLSDDIVEPGDDDYGQPDRIDAAEVMSQLVNVYNLHGVLVRRQVPYGQFSQGLTPGIYIVNGRKVAVGR